MALGIAIGTIDTTNEIEENYAPYIQDGNWWIGGEDTGYPACGIDGQTPTIEISEDGYWVINGSKTEYKSQGEVVIPTIGQDGYWYVGDEKLGLAVAKNIEFNVSDTHIQWRYEGETEWKNLVALETLKGADGADGKDGVDGEDGKDGLNGTDGKDGVDGADGKDGVDGEDGKDGQNGTDGKDGIDGIDGIGLNYKSEDGWFYVKYDNQTEYTAIWNFKYNAATPAACAEVALELALEELADLAEGLTVAQALAVIETTTNDLEAMTTNGIDSIETLNTFVASLDAKVAATKTKVNEILANVYEVFYFFSAAPGVSPEVQKVVAGETLELLIPNGTQLINGQVKWFSYELNTETGKYQLVEITEGYVMPEKDLYLYANYDGQLKPVVSFVIDGVVYYELEYKYFAEVAAEELNDAANQIDFTVEDLRGYEFVAWYFDADYLFPVSDFTILGDVTVYAKVTAKPYNVTFDVTYGTTNDELTQVVLFKEYITPIKATRLGYELAGWYLDGELFDLATQKMPARDITLTAKWVAVDVVDKLADKANEVIADVLNLGDVTDSPVYVTTEYNTYVSPENEELELVNYVKVNIDLDKLANIKSYGVDRSFFTKDNLVKLAKVVLDYLMTEKDMVNDITLANEVVFADNQFKTSVINDLAYNLITTVLNDLANEVNPKLTVTVDDVLCGRNVEVEVVLLGSAERVAQARDAARRLAVRFEIENNNNLEITFDVPSSAIQLLEKFIAEKFAGVSLYAGINKLSIEDAIRLVLNTANDLVGDKTGADEKLYKYLYDYQNAINRVISSERYSISINGVEVFLDGAKFAPATATYDDVTEALISVINPELLEMTFGEFDADYDRTYTIVIDAQVTLPDTDKVDQTVISQQVVINLVTKANKYQVVLDANGGTFSNGTNKVTLYEITGYDLPTDVVRPSYTFVCWVDQNGKEYTSIPAEYITLTAKWASKQFTIEYDVNGVEAELTYNGTTELVYDVTYVDGCVVDADGVVALATVNPVDGSQQFLGWELNGVMLTQENMADLVLAALGNGTEITLVAKWA